MSNQPIPTIQEVTASAWYKIGKLHKGAHQYKLLVWQQQVTMLNNTENSLAYWHIEYQGFSFYQPFITVTAITADAALKRFEEELRQFQPATIAEIEERFKS